MIVSKYDNITLSHTNTKRQKCPGHSGGGQSSSAWSLESELPASTVKTRDFHCEK